MSGPMVVNRVSAGGQSWVEPALDNSWSELDQLRWKAAVVALDDGIEISVEPANVSTKRFGRWCREYGFFDFFVDGASIGAFDFRNAWSFLNGAGFAARAFNKSQSKSVPGGPASREGSAN